MYRRLCGICLPVSSQDFSPPLLGRGWGQYCSARRLLAAVLFVFFQFEMSSQLILGGPADEVVAEHFEGSLGRLAARGAAEQHTGNQSRVDLERDAVQVVADQMPCPQHALHPAEEEFDLP